MCTASDIRADRGGHRRRRRTGEARTPNALNVAKFGGAAFLVGYGLPGSQAAHGGRRR